MPKAPNTDTKSHIINVAEHHFALHGFEGATLRGIIKDANVNVAAVAYHFGTKEELFGAVVQRFAAPVVTQQLEQLRIQMISPNVSVTDIVTAFYYPPIALVKDMGPQGEILSLFLGRAQTEPDPVYSIVDERFALCRNEFIDALSKARPSFSVADHHWNFEFMLSLIVTFLTRQKYIASRYSEDNEWQADEVVARLSSFCTAGIDATGPNSR